MRYKPPFILMQPDGGIFHLVIRLKSIEKDWVVRRNFYPAIHGIKTFRVMLRMVPVEFATFTCHLFLNELSEIFQKGGPDPFPIEK